MTVRCPACGKALGIPPEKASVPGLRIRCPGCREVFALSAAAAPAPPTSPPRPAASAPAPAAAARPAGASPPRPGVVPPRTWRRCANHPSVPSVGVCPQCGKGWCGQCVRLHGTASICHTCDALCVLAPEQEKREAAARMRARPLRDELGTVFRYPFTDPVAFALLSVFVGVFAVAASLAAFGAGFGLLFSQGLLYAYAFTAINRVSGGDLKSFMPNLGDISDLVEPMRVGLAALLISTGPLLLLAFLHPPDAVLESLGATTIALGTSAPSPEPTLDPEVQALLDAMEEEGDGPSEDDTEARMAEGVEPAPGVPAWVILAFLLALAWKVVYSPVALVAAAISRSFVTTLNPVAGLDAIRKMGGTYWSAMGVYTLVVTAEALVVGVLGLVPLAGRFVAAFVQSYAYLAIGCLLGFAVYKKAPDLGLD